jgi:hypothetical protein
LGNAAALLRVGSILLAPLFPGTQGNTIDTFLFSLSGPFGLALAICGRCSATRRGFLVEELS